MVPGLKLDDSGLPPPNLIKMDFEGAESAVLEVAQRILRDTRPLVFVALHGADQRTKCAALLRAADYALYDLKGQSVDGVLPTDEIYGVPHP